MEIYMSSNEDAEDQILKEGKQITARILECRTSDDPRDSEHMLFDINFAYEINGVTVQKNIKFSFNIVHLGYAHTGGLLGVPRLSVTPDDFIKALSPGETLEVQTLETPPYDFITTFNETAVSVMKYDAMWM